MYFFYCGSKFKRFFFSFFFLGGGGGGGGEGGGGGRGRGARVSDFFIKNPNLKSKIK